MNTVYFVKTLIAESHVATGCFLSEEEAAAARAKLKEVGCSEMWMSYPLYETADAFVGSVVERRRAALRESALAKLTDAERAVLGIEP